MLGNLTETLNSALESGQRCAASQHRRLPLTSMAKKNLKRLDNNQRQLKRGRSLSPLKNTSAINEEEVEDTSKRKVCIDVLSPLTTACDTRGFKMLMGQLSHDRLLEIEMMGFGPVENFKCRELNLQLCQILMDRFDVKTSTICINGRNLAVTAKDVSRIMGFSHSGDAVSLEGNLKDPDILYLKKLLCGKEDAISVDFLRNTLLEESTSEDMFRKCFCLFALSTLIAPSKANFVDPRFLLVVRDGNAICHKDWSTFTYETLLNGISGYQNCGYGPVRGCMLFLQLFYLDVHVISSLVVGRSELPMNCWGSKNMHSVFRKIEEHGGFYANHLEVSKRHAVSNPYSGSCDASTGVKISVVDDLNEIKHDMVSMKEQLDKFMEKLVVIGPRLDNLRSLVDRLVLLSQQFGKEGMETLVANIMKRVVVMMEPKVGFADYGRYGLGLDDLSAWIDNVIKVVSGEQTGRCPIGRSVLQSQYSRSSPLGSVARFDYVESRLIKYVFSHADVIEEGVGRNEVARFCNFSLMKRELTCLTPNYSISAEVINLSGIYYAATNDQFWFLPTMFSEQAKEIGGGVCIEGLLPDVVISCGLVRYNSNLGDCKQIYIPVHDGVLSHWYLVVVNMADAVCEIWDSFPNPIAEQRRKQYAIATMSMLKAVFWDEISKCAILSVKMLSYTISYPIGCPTMSNNYDSGIYVIRNIQHYREQWHVGFNSSDQRVRIALELCHHPKNEVRKKLWEAVVEYEAGKCAGQKVPSMPVSSAKFMDNRPRRN